MNVDDDLGHRPLVPIEPAERVIRRRRGARVLVLADDRILLEQDTDPGLPGTTWWVTPGGGVDRGESHADAAVRELREETGLVVAKADLVGPIARRLVHHGYTDQVLVQDEEFFVVRTGRFEVDTSGYTAEEKRTLLRTAWMARAEVAAATVWPREILELWDRGQEDLIDLGSVEESTIPLTDGQRAFLNLD
ncbi:NUDIX domain-containing protein [uncultured Propionibacterium sp.]|uniref:NUDIX hydrolase n=1 Tax=uncultured Propionibacterium sp. TaxID=218066 RepID=UPI00292FE685|nr:NUDIX domain-containing protein [uncultured Propionibacterium sp.]